MAARIARMFRIDPVLVLDADTTEWLIRVAAFTINNNDARRTKVSKGGK